MPAVRLVFLVALVVGVLAVIAASTTSTRTDGPRTGTTGPQPGASAPSAGRTVRATAPRKGPLVVRVGDVVDLTVTLPDAARLVIDELGVHENVGPNLPTLVPFTAIAEGTYDLKVQTTGESVLRIVVRPADEGRDGGSRERQPQVVPADEPRPV